MLPLRDSGFILRRFDDSDAEPFVVAVLESQSTVGRWMDWATPAYSTRDALQWFEDCSKGFESGLSYQFGMFFEDSAEFVGGVGISQVNRRNGVCNIGYWVRESRQRQGAAMAAVRMLRAFAFGSIGLTRAEIVVAVGNIASMEIARRSGAKHECVARNRLILGGAPTSAHVFSLVPGDEAGPSPEKGG